MGQQGGSAVLGLAGAVIGGLAGGPAGAAIGSMAGGLIGSLIFNRSTKPLINDVQVGNASYGNPIPIIYGTARLSGTMIWQDQVQTSSSVLGKGLGGQPLTHYHQSAAFAFCEGPATLVRIFLDGNLFWDASKPNTQLTRHTFLIRNYNGTEAQLADPDISAWVAENVAPGGQNPAYRGLCYLVCVGVDLINYGNRFPQVTAVWTATGAAGVYDQNLTRPADDVADHPQTIPVGTLGIGQRGTAPDWASGYIYSFSDGVLRAFSIATGAMLYLAPESDFLPGVGYTVQGLAIGQSGQYLYVYGQKPGGFSTSWVRALVPSTFRPAAAETEIVDPLGGYIAGLAVVENQSVTGSREGLVGYLNGGNGFLCSVLAGGSIGAAQDLGLTLAGLGAVKCFIPGNYDPVTGIQVYYILSWGFLDTSGDIFLETFQTDGASTLGAAVNGTISASFWGGIGTISSNPGAAGWYDPADGCLVLASGVSAAAFSVIKINPVSLAIIWQASVPNASFTGEALMPATDLTQGKIVFADGFGWHMLETASGDYVTVTTPITGGAPLSWDGTREAMLTYDLSTGNLHILYFNFVSTAGVSVAAIILDLCARVGVTADLVDVTLVTQQAEGYVVPDAKSAGQAILDLCHTYMIDIVESDYKLKFVPRGQAPVVTIPQGDLASADAQDAGKYWTAKESPQQELPLVLTVKYIDPVLDYQPGSAYAKRVAAPIPTVFSKRRKTVDLPVIATSVEARTVAETWLYAMWAERWTYQTALGPKYLWLDPGDNVLVAFNDGTLPTVRIEKVETGADLSLRLDLASEDLTTYTTAGGPGAAFGAQPQSLPFLASATLLQFNVPLLRDADATDGNTGRVYFAAGSTNPAAFLGGTAYRTQVAPTYTMTGGVSSGASWGRAAAPLGIPPTLFATDIVNTLTVMLSPGSTPPSNAAYIDLMNGANPALVGAEVIQFTTAEENIDGSWTLSGLLRGRRGTDWATDGHTDGELVILLGPTTVGAGTMQLAEFGITETWKLVPPGGTIPAAPVTAFAYRAFDLFPYAPVCVAGVYSGSDIALTWSRRTRIGGLLVDGTDTIPLGETSEAYEVDILDAAGAALKRTLAGLSSPAATYTAANITTDFGTPPATLFVRVYQKSSVVGRGFALLWHLDLASGEVISCAGVAP